MEISGIIPHIEALIFASEKPLTPLEITELINNAFGFMEDKITLDQIEAALEGIIEKYRSEFYPFEVRESGGGWQFLTKKDFHKTVAQLNGDKFLKRLSSAALETLAIIAYKQPITKGEIESIRGVSSDYSVQKLLEKELIHITGRSEELPGKPLVYCTTKAFMDYFGLNSADDLPRIKEVLADQLVEPTIIADQNLHPEDEAAEIETDEKKVLAVTENGELIEAITQDDLDAQSDAEALTASVDATEEYNESLSDSNEETNEEEHIEESSNEEAEELTEEETTEEFAGEEPGESVEEKATEEIEDEQEEEENDEAQQDEEDKKDPE